MVATYSTPDVRTCSKCNAAKPLTDFPYASKKKNERHSACKDCVNLFRRNTRANNPEKERARDRAYWSEHPEQKSTKDKRWRSTHKEYLQEYFRNYERENGEQRRAKSRARYAANAAKRRASQKASRAASPDKRRVESARYRATYPEEIRQRKQAYYAANAAKVRAKSSLWYSTHIEQVKVQAHRYRVKNRDKKLAIQERRRERKRNAPYNDLTAAQWRMIKEHYGHRCVYCDRKMARLTIDHIVPISKGGSHTLQNVVPACQSCNSRKNDGPVLKPVQPLLLI